jgi:dTDP-4-amino-4,6-dideoxygalactose transaminase
MRIQVGDFKMGEEEKKAINEVLDSGRISEGKKVREFEIEFAKFIGTEHSILLNSGTSAIIAGLTALKYYKNGKFNDRKGVITTPVTYIATSNAIMITGFEPVYVDVDPETFVIRPDDIKACLEGAEDPNKFSLILPVHLMGYPCDMDKINKIAKKYDMETFEDSAQSHGTIYNGRKTGSMSLLSDFSFYIAHNIQVGEMGAITTNDPEILRLIRKIKANGRMCDCYICTRNTMGCPKLKSSKENDDFDPRFTHDMIGYNFKTMEFQASLGLLQLKRIDCIIKRRSENVKYLNEGLEKFSDVLQLPKFSENISYLAYPMVIKKPEKISRKRMQLMLEKSGIETRYLFGCIPTQQPAYSFLKEKYKNGLPNAENIGRNGFYIGCHQYLTQEDLDYVISVFEEILGKSH